MTTPAQPQPEPAPQIDPTSPTVSEHRQRRPEFEDGSTAELTAQAAHLRRLSARIDQLTDDLADLRVHTDQVTAIAADIQHTLDPAEPPGVGGDTGPPRWASMTAETAAPAWEAIADWIDDTLVPWYGITRDQLPDCWALHPPAVTELSWLHHTHHAAYQPGAPAHLVADWHTHWKPAALHHIHDAIPRRGHRTCTPGHHLATDTERTPHLAASPPALATRDEPQTPPTEQLAHRQHWHAFYRQAVTDDLATRRR